MSLWTSDPSKAEYVREYFSSINPMAARIVDVQSNLIKSMSKEKWMNMSAAEQEKALDQCIITPEAALRYRSNKPTSQLPKFYQSVFPKLIVETGQVYAARLDDSKEKEAWKDEHSDPFSWETRSQMNMPLPLPSKEKTKQKPIAKSSNVPEAKAVKTQQNGKAHHAGLATSKVPTAEISDKLQSKVTATSQKNETDLETGSVEIELLQSNFFKPKPTDGLDTNLVAKHEQSIDGAKRQVKTKSSSRGNPKSSFALEGAIRNLEVAKKEEQKVERSTEPTPTSTISMKPPPETDISKLELIEDSPLLDSSPSLPFDLEVNAKRNSLQKSGFDFLDNW